MKFQNLVIFSFQINTIRIYSLKYCRTVFVLVLYAFYLAAVKLWSKLGPNRGLASIRKYGSYSIVSIP